MRYHYIGMLVLFSGCATQPTSFDGCVMGKPYEKQMQKTVCLRLSEDQKQEGFKLYKLDGSDYE